MDLNLVDRANVDAYCPKIRKKRQNVHSHVGCLKPSVWEMEITVYPLHGQSIGPTSTALNRGRLVTSIRRDTTASEPIPTRWASNMGGKTHFIQARPKDMCLFLHFPIHTWWAVKQTLLVRNRYRLMLRLELALVFLEEERVMKQ